MYSRNCKSRPSDEVGFFVLITYRPELLPSNPVSYVFVNNIHRAQDELVVKQLLKFHVPIGWTWLRFFMGRKLIRGDAVGFIR